MRKLSETMLRAIEEDPFVFYWIDLCRSYEFSEEFIEKYQEYIGVIGWEHIFRHQKLSEGFLIKFMDKPYFACVYVNKHISKDVKDRIIAMKELMQA
jgi:hypothetical protein